MSSRFDNCPMNLDTNWVPLSDMTCFGVPCSFQTFCKKSSAIPLESTSLTVGMKCACLENRSTTTKMLSFPSLLGKSTMRLQVIFCHGAVGISLGFSGPWGFLGNILVCLHLSQPST